MDTLSPPIATTPCVERCSETFFTNDNSEVEIRRGQAQADSLQDYRHLVAASAAVGVEVKGRVPTTFRVPDAVRGGHGAAECEVTSTTITRVDRGHIDFIDPMAEVVDRVRRTGRAFAYVGKHERVMAAAAPQLILAGAPDEHVVAGTTV